MSKNAILAFCNKVTASSKLTQVTTAQIETVGKLTGVGKSANVPAALNYEISVTPDANFASGYADGIFTTIFTASIMEGRSDIGVPSWTSAQRAQAIEDYKNGLQVTWIGDPFEDWDELGTTLTFIDSASTAGGVSTFNKGASQILG